MGRISDRRLVWLVPVLALAAGAWAWHRYRPAPDDAPVLIVGDQRGGTQALLQAAGELDHVPYRIEWALFPAASPLLEALNSNAIDIGGIGGQPFAFAYASGAKIRVVYAGREVAGPTRGEASAIIVPANSPLHRVEDLKGHKLATVRGSAGQNLALQLLERHGLKPTDVTWVYLDNAGAKSALSNGSIDAWSTWSSYVGFALVHDHQRALADARDLPPEVGFYAANDRAITTKRAQIVDFNARVTRAQKWVGTHLDAYAAVLAKQTGLPLDVARFTAHIYAREAVPVDDALRAEEQGILARYKAAGLIDTVPDLNGAFDNSFAPGA